MENNEADREGIKNEHGNTEGFGGAGKERGINGIVSAFNEEDDILCKHEKFENSSKSQKFMSTSTTIG